MNLGNLYSATKKMPEAENMYQISIETYERLAKGNPAQFESDLARVTMALGNYYLAVKKMPEAEKMYLRSFEIYERLAKRNPTQFEPDLAMAATNFGVFYFLNQKTDEAEKRFLFSVEIYERLVKSNPARFERPLRWVYGGLYEVYLITDRHHEVVTAVKKTLSLDSSKNWVRVYLAHSYLLRGKWKKAKRAYKQYIVNEKDPTAAKKTLLQGWDELEAEGVTHPDMEKARKWVRE